ncbi:MAG: alpha/beta fold hydrolase [Bradymonadaceae bacterium]
MTDHTSTTSRTVSPDDWPTAAARTYARRQMTLADHHGVDVESRVADTDTAGRLHFLVAGPPDGEPVVLLHGLHFPAASWLSLFPTLADRYRVYAPDRPGRGLTAPRIYDSSELRSCMVEYLRELFDISELDRPHVVGSSLGGLQALLLAVDHDRARKLCLVGAAAGLGTPAFIVRLMSLPVFNELIFRIVYRGMDSAEDVREWLGQMAVRDPSAVSRQFCELFAAHNELPNRLASERSLVRAETTFGQFLPMFVLRDDLENLDVPTGFVWGEDDAVKAPDEGRKIADRMPDAEFQLLPEHGHLPWLEPGDRAGDSIRAFLTK